MKAQLVPAGSVPFYVDNRLIRAGALKLAGAILKYATMHLISDPLRLFLGVSARI